MKVHIFYRHYNTQGTDNSSIALTSTAGGITMKVADEKELTMENAVGNAYVKIAPSVTPANEQVRIVNTKGTGGSAISLSSVAGGVDINASTSITLDGTILSLDGTDSTNLTMMANSAATKTLTIAATNSDVDNVANIDIDADGALTIDTTDKN